MSPSREITESKQEDKQSALSLVTPAILVTSHYASVPSFFREQFSPFLDAKTLNSLTQLNHHSNQLFQPALRLRQVAREILSDNPDPEKVIAVVQKDPSMLNHPVNTVWRGRKIFGTLLQIAAMAGDINLRDKKAGEKDHGIVERLMPYLPAAEVRRQLQVVFPTGWEKISAARIQPYIDATMVFMEGIIKIQIQLQHTIKDWHITNQAKLKAACQPHIDNFQTALNTHADEVITSGYIYDPSIIDRVIELFVSNVGRFGPWGGWDSEKTNLFWVIIIGSLQASLLGCDRQVFKTGIFYVVEKGQDVDRSSNSAADRLAELGTSFFLDMSGERQACARFYGGHTAITIGLGRYNYQTYTEQKQERCSLYAIIKSPSDKLDDTQPNIFIF
jgi:hypothetical protein